MQPVDPCNAPAVFARSKYMEERLLRAEAGTGLTLVAQLVPTGVLLGEMHLKLPAVLNLFFCAEYLHVVVH